MRIFGPFVVLLFEVVYIKSEVEICTDGGQHVYQISQKHCPFGVFFSQPQAADCLVYTGEDESSILADVCTKEAYSADKKMFQFIPEISADEIEPGNSCKTIQSSVCNSPTQHIHPNSFLRQVTRADVSYAMEPGSDNKDPVKEQTMRMLEYAIGLGKVDIDESQRITFLLKKTFSILKKFCSSKFLPIGFSEDVESTFMFLLNEADSTGIKDITYEEYERIMEHLVFCEDQSNPLKFDGKQCATYSMIQRVNKSGHAFSEFDKSNDDAFKKYDVSVEATWGAIDFVHGLCYGTFRDHINSHHLYQQALERLFTKEILYRWKNRYVFEGRQYLWNHFFSANVKLALTNLDYCVQASYLSTPFQHRLERPIDVNRFAPSSPPTAPAPAPSAGGPAPAPPAPPTEPAAPAAPAPDAAAPPPSNRKKRWVESHALRELSSVEGYCFQTKEAADAVLAKACE